MIKGNAHCKHLPVYSLLLNSILILVLLSSASGLAHASETRQAFTYKVKRGDTLIDIALRYGVSVEQLRQWNEFETEKIIIGQRLKIHHYPLKKRYRVRSGDTLSEIAATFGVSAASIRRINHLSGNRIYAGQELRLYLPGNNVEGPKTHLVKKGDTLWDIANLYGTTVLDLKEINDLQQNSIIPGMVLNVTESPEESPFMKEHYEYRVKKGDNLSSIAQRFDVGMGLLRQLNQIKGNRIYPGQKLQLRPSSLEEVTHVVRKGESLSSIALKYRINLTTLKELNDIKGSKILINQKLRLRSTPASTHIVEQGDALWEIARAYGMSVKDLKQLNGLSSNRIYPGQKLHLGLRQSGNLDVYTVRQGDCLSDIARLHQMSVSELKIVNHLHTATIFPGERLKVNPLLRSGREWLSISEINWDDLMNSPNGAETFKIGNGPYYFSRPNADRQKHRVYFESKLKSPLGNYKQARILWRSFGREVEQLGRLSNTLRGWCIVLDPGHGGLDPGAIVKTRDGNDGRVFIVEDEYVHDVALRVYVLLRLHGANVTMTLLSPNHLIRHSDPPTQTFVNEKNEVYNSYSINKSNKWGDWPNGGYNGNISNRVRIARNAFKDKSKNRCIFLSFHADVNPRMPDAPLVLYYKNRKSKRVDVASKKFAQALLPALGAGSYARGQNLAVLRNNPAKLKVLLELRNLAFTDHAWALRFEALRQRDAEKIVKGILDYIQPDTQMARRATQ